MLLTFVNLHRILSSILSLFLFADAFQIRFGRSSDTILLYSFFHLTSQSHIVAPRLSRHKWCSWSEWSRCSPVTCVNQINERPVTEEAELAKAEPLDGDSFCVVQPTAKSKKVIWTAVVQYVRDGVTRTRTPVKRRTRLCNCPSFSIFNLVGLLGKNQCDYGSEETQCSVCNADEPIYSIPRVNEQSRLLPFCDPFANGSFHLYKILGGVAGGVVIVLFFVWLIRILCRSVSRSRRVAARIGAEATARTQPPPPSRDIGWSVDITGDGTVRDPLNRHRGARLDHDSPPAYKDVVSNLLEASSTPVPSSQKPEPPPRSEALSSSSPIVTPNDPSTPPPPSYADVVSGIMLTSVRGEEAHVSANTESQC